MVLHCKVSFTDCSRDPYDHFLLAVRALGLILRIPFKKVVVIEINTGEEVIV